MKKTCLLVLWILSCFWGAGLVYGQNERISLPLEKAVWPEAKVSDGGKKVHITFALPKSYQNLSSQQIQGIKAGYEIWRAEGSGANGKEGKFERLGKPLSLFSVGFTDESGQSGKSYFYKIRTFLGDKFVETSALGPVFMAPRGIGKVPSCEIIKEKSPDSPMASLVVQVTWECSPDDGDGIDTVKEYIIQRALEGSSKFEEIGRAKAGSKNFKDAKAEPGKSYLYQIQTTDGTWTSDSPPSKAVSVSLAFFDMDKIFVFIFVILFTGIFFYFVDQGRKGKELKLRRIEGLNAIEEAIGRATEMGKPVLYVPGIDDIQELQTVASLIILSHVSKTTSQYETPLIVPCRDSVVMTMAEEVVKDSAISVSRPDAFNPDNIRFLSSEQFAYVAGVDGIMLREKPAANLYLGSFYAESLILAETGHSSKAIQVAGTANYSQLPFFIVACDYTIIGEEFYAASAYLSHDPKIIGSIKAADYFKLTLIVFIVVVTILACIHQVGIDIAQKLL